MGSARTGAPLPVPGKQAAWWAATYCGRQWRDLACVPPPHVRVHGLHGVHGATSSSGVGAGVGERVGTDVGDVVGADVRITTLSHHRPVHPGAQVHAPRLRFVSRMSQRHPGHFAPLQSALREQTSRVASHCMAISSTTAARAGKHSRHNIGDTPRPDTRPARSARPNTTTTARGSTGRATYARVASYS